MNGERHKRMRPGLCRAAMLIRERAGYSLRDGMWAVRLIRDGVLADDTWLAGRKGQVQVRDVREALGVPMD